MDSTAQNHSQAFTETLHRLSIFEMLGVEGTEEEKEEFLSEVQDVIWQDVVENDLAPILSDEEADNVHTLLNDEGIEQNTKRDYLFDLILKKVPQAEDVLLQRTLQLKSDLLHERLHGMQEYFSNNAASMQKLQTAHQLIENQDLDAAVAILNELSASA